MEDTLLNTLTQNVERILGHAVDVHCPLIELGLTSMQTVQFFSKVQSMLDEEARSRVNVTALLTGLSLDGLIKMIEGDGDSEGEQYEPIEVVTVIDDKPGKPTLVFLEEQAPHEFMKGSGVISYDNVADIARSWDANAQVMLWTDRSNFDVTCDVVASRMYEMLGDGEYIIAGHSAMSNVAIMLTDKLLKSGRTVSKLLVADPCHIPQYGPGFKKFIKELKDDPAVGQILPPSDLWRCHMLANSEEHLPQIDIPVIALLASDRGPKWEPAGRSMAKLQSLCNDPTIIYTEGDHLDVFRDDSVYQKLSPQETVYEEKPQRSRGVRLSFKFW
jgi:hypothetical protein